MPFSLDIIKHNEFYFNDYAQIKAKGHSPVPSIIYPLSSKKLLLRLYKLQICWLERHNLFLRPTSGIWSMRLKSWYTWHVPLIYHYEHSSVIPTILIFSNDTVHLLCLLTVTYVDYFSLIKNF